MSRAIFEKLLNLSVSVKFYVKISLSIANHITNQRNSVSCNLIRNFLLLSKSIKNISELNNYSSEEKTLMTNESLGTTTITQVAIVVHNIEEKAHA